MTKKTTPRKNTKTAYSKGSRPSSKGQDKTPMIVAIGLILILVLIIAMIVRSMFTAGSGTSAPTARPQQTAAQQTPENNFIVFGATNTPVLTVTATPNIEITPTPAPTQAAASTTYKTLRRGDQGVEVKLMQEALTELGFLKGAADGNFGTGTKTAVEAFQSANGLDVDGIAGAKTLEKLYSLSSVTPVPDVTVTAAPGDILDLPG